MGPEFHRAHPSLVGVAETNIPDLVVVPEHMRKTSYNYRMMHGFKLEFLFLLPFYISFLNKYFIVGSFFLLWSCAWGPSDPLSLHYQTRRGVFLR